MDKKTLLAIILSTVVISAGFLIQAKFFPAPEQEVVEETAVTQTEEVQQTESVQNIPKSQSASSKELIYTEDQDDIIAQKITAETERFIITFSNEGGVLTSLKLKEHLDMGEPLEMIFAGDSGKAAFELSFGDWKAVPVDDKFKFRRVDEYTFEFYRTYLAPADSEDNRVPFILTKTYKFTPEDYMLELRIGIENSVNKIPSLNFDGYSYTLSFVPQIGPEFTKLDNRYFYRRFYTYEGKKASVEKIKDNYLVLEDRVTWTGVAGKYFAAIAVPDATQYEITLSEMAEGSLPQGNEIYFSRPPVKSSNNEDVFKFYMGPKLKKYLLPYNSADENGFAMKDLNLDEIEDSSSILGWLEWILQKILVLAYKLIPNYGIGIIILTIIMKVVLFPFTKKSYQSTAKMSALSPKMEELKAQYKDQPQKLNAAMGELYKKEGVSPMGGCLPMLLQFPVFIAMYGLMNKYFEFRGAVFIPGWINDLAMPESILHFAGTLPLLGWSDLRLLPIIFVGTQILSQKIMQSNQTSAAAGNMKMMMYMMPVMFFFILYNAPSGLLVYWIFSNLFTMLQQMYTNKHLKPAAAGKGGADFKITGNDSNSADNKKKVAPPAKKKPKKKGKR